MRPNLKYQLIEQNVESIPSKKCAFYGVSRSGYYRYQKHKDIPAKEATLASMISECQGVQGKIHGHCNIQLWLEKIKGIHRNPKTVLRIMRKYGLLSEVRRRRWQSCGQSIHRYVNIFNRNFKTEQPN